VIASLDQMRDGTTLTLQTPPQRIPLAIPACGGLLDCPYEQFKTFITSNVKTDCIVTATSDARQSSSESPAVEHPGENLNAATQLIPSKGIAGLGLIGGDSGQ
jgi:hypothetical protein